MATRVTQSRTSGGGVVAAQNEPYARRWWALIVLCLAMMIISLDNTILNVALPTLVRDLHASTSQLQWMVDAYTLVFAGLLLTAGSIGDRFGRKKALIGGLFVFGAFSALSSFSRSADQLIGARALMGIGGALIFPTTLSILTNIFPPKERVRAIGIWSGVAGIAIPLGPVVGGWMLEHFHWGSVFLINVPIAAVAILASLILIPVSKDAKAKPLDPLGAILSIAALGTLLYGIIEAPTRGWGNAETLGLIAAGLVLLGVFVLWERRTTYPMLNMSLFKNARFSAASISVTLVFFGLMGSMFFLTQYMQFVLGYSTLQAGAAMIPVAFGVSVGAPVSSKLTERFGAKLLVTIGMLVTTVSMLILTQATTHSGYIIIGATLLVGGLGMGLAMTPATDSIMGAVPKDNAGAGSAVNDTTRQFGGALGVAILGSLLSTTYTSKMTPVLDKLPAALHSVAQSSVGGALAVAHQLGGPTGNTLAVTAKSAFVHGMTLTAVAASGFTFLGAIIALLFLPARGLEAEEMMAEGESEELDEVSEREAARAREFETAPSVGD
ncbi:MAG TPA: MFS transporter [Thermomicrobiaceae bacterium]|nr:MFS transporter [Thermomicrobiaceae bacterium]